MKKKRRIFYLTTELAPFHPESPLSEMSLHLTKIYRSLGHDIRVVVPKANIIRDRKYNLREVIRMREIPVPLSGKLTWAAVKSGFIPETKVQVYFLEHEKYFNRDGILDDPVTGKPYPDNDERFIVYCRAAVEMLRILSWQPQIIHCTDWTSALVGFYLKTMYYDHSFFQPSKVVLSIVNCDQIGAFPPATVFKAGINPETFKSGIDLELNSEFCFLKTGMMYADKIIYSGPSSLAQFPPQFQNWCQGYLQKHSNMFSQIRLGLDHHIWNPDKDDKIPVNFSYRELAGKTENKIKLIEKYALKIKTKAPLIGCIWDGGDFTPLNDIISILKNLGGGFVVADKSAGENVFDKFTRSYPEHIGSIKLLTGLSLKQLLAGADMMLLAPTKCRDLLHLKAMKYGAIPIVPNVGCFGDDIETDEDKENGFLYNHYDWKSLKEAVSKALQSYQNPKSWGKLIQRAMKYDTTWNKVARSYQEIYDSIE